MSENKTGKVQLDKGGIDIIAKGVQLLLEQKQTLYKRMGVPKSLEAIKDYEAKLIEINNIEVLLKNISNSSCIVITPPEGYGVNTANKELQNDAVADNRDVKRNESEEV